ncbi:tRNA epoxyqueuosine(34) reductase QueG [Thermosynechococcus sp. JY1334]|uniref:tRNA epoxyqueuosine(34) reductase QueG n=1 Tax=unclassified Thermosynechococcus TaxID=2622553 RepID=UPI0026710E12|nr:MULTISPECIES: tRNA epoxyqueuosine(34) reductase QueG [unclassified Thermosynechococcus]MDR7899224.1 tRNA epoxyqueuosine(34) reductase QueG [Thermosynechococcus sp. JY1332]MDR7906628.1 tRNA epoxyqueuosine(34) reductase QueG [Thermosynechococcus sp. JY1334]MDR7994454.1 tRNA epoxyqueuosine(34) reductase QueG [Thermosynechococcus sp. TG252]WKT86346.1 tRNA epoxyqueuosine(34) reductase QueG [Thermosynechococcus sp. JY1339]WNC55290.1 tRNA epoxyqueuosine(34) reductase QueG [Thermosynechococcus sp. 
MITAAAIKQFAHQLGFHRVGIVDLRTYNNDHPSGVAALQRWLAQGFQGEMAWMANPRRQEIQAVLPGAQSVISVALNYYQPDPEPPPKVKIARYGWGRDYHRVLGKRLQALGQWLQSQVPEVDYRWYVDTGPVQDKVWAEQAGIGWIGKHSNVISRQYGSWIFLGELITTLELTGDRPHTNHCGTCTRCLAACPTGAIVEPYVVDANRCIAYHTIESRAPEIPPAIAAHLEGWVAGCDICQEVCPWNQRFAQPTDVADFAPRSPLLKTSLEELATLSDAAWDELTRGSALRRIKPAQWRRNAQAVLSANRYDEK